MLSLSTRTQPRSRHLTQMLSSASRLLTTCRHFASVPPCQAILLSQSVGTVGEPVLGKLEGNFQPIMTRHPHAPAITSSALLAVEAALLGRYLYFFVCRDIVYAINVASPIFPVRQRLGGGTGWLASYSRLSSCVAWCPQRRSFRTAWPATSAKKHSVPSTHRCLRFLSLSTYTVPAQGWDLAEPRAFRFRALNIQSPECL